jgi:ketopantoate reductase
MRRESARPRPIYPPVWAALRHGGPLEADANHRRLLALAARAGLAATVNARLLEILLRQAESGSGPESVAASEILKP